MTGSLEPGTDFDRLVVLAVLPDEETPLGAHTFEGRDLKLPVTVNFVSGKSTAAGTKIELLATAELRKAVVSSTRGEAVLEAKAGSALTLTLPAPVVQPDAGPGLQEICDNGIDDDADARADCADNDCEGKACHAGGLVCSGRRCHCGEGSAGTVSDVGNYLPRLEPQAVRLTAGAFGGYVAVLGGRLEDGGSSATVELVSVQNGSITASTLNAAREQFSVLAQPDGGILAVGGHGGGAATASLELFRGTASGFTLTPLSPALRAVGSAAALHGDKVLLAGGQLQDVGDNAQLSAKVYRVALFDDGATPAGTAVSTGTMSEPRGASGALLGSGDLLMVGGAGAATSEKTDLIAPDGTVRAGPALPAKFSDMAAISLADGRVLILGGRMDNAGTPQPSARVFVATASAQAVSLRELPPMLSSKVKPRVARLDNGWVYVDEAAGGSTKPEWFDPVSETFIAAVPPSPQRNNYAVVASGPSSVMLVGGGPANLMDGKIVTLSLSCP